MQIDIVAWIAGLLVGSFFGPWILSKLRGGSAPSGAGMPYGGSAGY